MFVQRASGLRGGDDHEGLAVDLIRLSIGAP